MTQPTGEVVEAPLTDEQKHDQFIEQSVAAGATREDSEAVYQIITKISPPITVKNVEALGLPLGDSEARVGREYDTTLEESFGLVGYTDIILHTPLGAVSFSVNRDELVKALTVEVPHVSPQKAPADA